MIEIWELYHRIGCVACDWVGAIGSSYTEEFVHGLTCPYCQEKALHLYPLFGSWPSDYSEPPCVN